MIRFFDGLLANYGPGVAPMAVNSNRRERDDLWLSVAAYKAIEAIGRVAGRGRSANDNSDRRVA
jgi:hypothetical protein